MTIFRSDITYDFLLLGACDFSFQSLNKDVLYTEKTQSHVNTHRVKLLIENDDIENETIQPDVTKQSETEIETSTTPRVNYKNMYRPHENSVKLYGAHANYYSLEGAKTMYDNKSMCISFFDKDYMMMFDKFENSAFICYPNLVITDISYSNLHHSYPFFSKSEELYYINCFDNFKFTDYNFIYLDIIFQHKGVKIRDDDTYESYMTRLIKYQFSSVKERETIKNRIVLNFFTINDLEKIRNNI
jgi:hypothetical protein